MPGLCVVLMQRRGQYRDHRQSAPFQQPVLDLPQLLQNLLSKNLLALLHPFQQHHQVYKNAL